MRKMFENFHLLTWNYEDHDFECLSTFPDSRGFYETNWRPSEEVLSVLYLATCNRVELYLQISDTVKKSITREELLLYLEKSPIAEQIKNILPVCKHGASAIKHFFQVTSGLRSMALGETQITGQVKRDIERASKNGYLTSLFENISKKALETQKSIRNNTEVGKSPISLLTLMEREIEAETGSQSNFTNVAIGGTGDMSSKVLKHVINKGAENITVIRHDTQRELPLEFKELLEKYTAGKNIQINFLTWDNVIEKSVKISNSWDILITATHSEKPVLTYKLINELREIKYLKQNAYVVDLGIPPNVEIVEKTIENKEKIINLQTLLKQSEQNLALRRFHQQQAMPLIEKSIHAFWMDQIYRNHPEVITTALDCAAKERDKEWENLLAGPLKNITNKQKRVLIDYFKKQERKTLRLHKEIFIEMLVTGNHSSISADSH
ncbi:MAG: hypothetical protein OEZ22_00870 [Spirochaetia bacterium]|nr:hypothetical protein [Spirochaetia bacterium]